MTQSSALPFELPPDDPPPADVAEERQEKSARRRSPPTGDDKRGGMQETKREVSTNGAPKPPNKTVIDQANENTKNPDAWPTNADALWPLVLGHLAESGVGPDQVVVHVSRSALGQFVAEKDRVKIGVIRGDSIKPYGGMSASEAQFFYLLNTYHCIPAPGFGKARYELEYRYADGTRIKTGYLELDSYATLKAIAERTSEIGAEITKAAASEASGQPARPPPIMPLPGQPQQHHYVPSPAQMGSMPTEMAMEWGVMKERERVRAAQENRPVQEVPPPTSMPNNEAAIAWEREKAAMQLAAQTATNALELKIKEMEMKQAAADAAREKAALLDRLAALEHRMSHPAESEEGKMLKQLIAFGVVQVGPDGKPVPVGAGASYVPPGKASTPEQQLMEAARVIAEGQKAGETTREVLRKTFGFENPSTEIVKEEEEKKPEPTWFDKVIAVGGGILEGAVKNPEGPLTALAHFTKGSQAGEMFAGLASAAAAGKAAVSASRVNSPPSSGGGGFKSSA
jgi:hypothetical protein